MTPDDASIIPEDDAGDFSVDASGDDDVSIGLVEAADVSIDAGTVTLAEITDGAVDLYTGTDVTISSVVSDSVIVAAGGQLVENVPAGVIDFTLTGANSDNVEVIPVVFVPDSSDDLLADGAFGIGGATNFVDVDALGTDPDADFDAAVGSTTSIEVGLCNDLGATTEQVVALDGQTIQYRVYDTSGTATTEDGLVSIDLDGADVAESDEWTLFFRWVGSGDYAGQTAVIDNGDELTVTWLDAEPAADVVAVADAKVFAETGGVATVQAEVTDQFGDPLAGALVEFTSAGGVIPDFTSTTNADGVASVSYTGPATSRIDADIIATIVDTNGDAVTGMTTGATTAGDVEVFWWVEADPVAGGGWEVTDQAGTGAATIEGRDGNFLFLSDVGVDADPLVVDDVDATFEVLRVELTGTDLYEVSGTASTYASFLTALETDEARTVPFEGATDTLLTIDNYLDSDDPAVTSTWDLTPATD